MPAQTQQKDMYFPDGCQVLIKAQGDPDYSDLGVIEGDATATFNWDENQIETGNAGKTEAQRKNMTVEFGFTLFSLNPDNISKLGGGLFTVTSENGTPVTTIPDQIIAAGWDDNKKYNMKLYTSSAAITELRPKAKPTITSITLDADGAPETLTENNDYVIVEDSTSHSGYSIVFMSAGITTLTPKTKAITIEYGTNTPIAAKVMTAGASTQVSVPVEMMFKHTDDDGLIRSFYMPSCSAASGGFQFNFKGANSEGLESMPISGMGKIDTTKANGAQLFQWRIEDNAA